MANQVYPLRFEYCDNRRLVLSRTVESILVLTLLSHLGFLLVIVITLCAAIVLTRTLCYINRLC